MSQAIRVTFSGMRFIAALFWVAFCCVVDWVIGLEKADSATRVFICVMVLFLAVYGFLALNFVGGHMAPRI